MEKQVKLQVKKILDKYRVWYFMPMGGGYGKSGIPDFVGCVNGRFIAIETKANGNKPTALQVKQLREIAEHKGVSIVINENNLQELDDLLAAL